MASEFEVWSGNFTKLQKAEKHRKKNIEHIQKRILDQVVKIKNDYSYKFYDGQSEAEFANGAKYQ